MTAGLLHAEATSSGLGVTTSSGATAVLSWRWVRDHGEDETSFDPATRQRRIYAIGAEEPAAALTAAIDTTINGVDSGPVIAVTWPEEPTETWISCATIEALITPPTPPSTTGWSHRDQVAVTKGDVVSVLTSDAALASWLKDISVYGFGLLAGFSGGHDEVTALANRIGYPRATIFGATWDLSSDIEDHDDTAYSQSFLAPHTDGTYSHEAPGLQMFCCIDRSGTGGESIVVDAFAMAETLRREFPDDFDLLTTINVPGHYIEPGIELRASRPAIRLDHDGNVVQVSMNNYDRSPMLLPPDELADFYRAYGRLHDLANDQSRWDAIRLEAGDVLINDNWRVLHGRHAYTGARRFIGCYLNHEDFESRLRTLSLC